MAKLRSIKTEFTPQILAGDVTDWGVYWVVREHFADAVPLADLFTPGKLTTPAHAEISKGLLSGVGFFYLVLVAGIGAKIAQSLERFSKHGVYHGGLDLSRTIGLRNDSSAVLFETGYCSLFGADYFSASPSIESGRPPERVRARKADAKSDIYSFGLILSEFLHRGMRDYGLPELNIQFAIDQLVHVNPSKRLQSWDEVATLFERVFDQINVGIRGRMKAQEASESAPPFKGDDEAEPTPRLLEEPAPVSIEVDVNELAVVALSSENDEAESTPRSPVIASSPVVVDNAPVTVRVLAPLAAPDIRALSVRVERAPRSPVPSMTRPGRDPALLLYGAFACAALIIVAAPYFLVWNGGSSFVNPSEGNQAATEWKWFQATRRSIAGYPE